MQEERRDQLTNINQEQDILDSGLEVSEMVMEYKNGQMELNMKGLGKIIGLMGKENSFMLMVIFMKVNG